jgi:hypothetical protein
VQSIPNFAKPPGRCTQVGELAAKENEKNLVLYDKLEKNFLPLQS